MSPSAEKAQCPFCLGRRRLKQDGTFYQHDIGRPGLMKTCPGAGLTPQAAKAAKSEGRRPEGPSGRPDSLRPEDIF